MDPRERLKRLDRPQRHLAGSDPVLQRLGELQDPQVLLDARLGCL